MAFHSRSLDEVLSDLGSDEDEGISEQRSDQILEEEGPNKIESEDSTSPLEILISQFKDNLIYLLFAAGILSLGVGLLPNHTPEYREAAVIFLILIANGTFGFVQDYRAEKSIQALKKMSTPKATVLRDGEKKKVESTEIVPGDIVYLEQGDAVPADARVIEQESLSTDESALTGESENVSKSTGTVDEEAPVADRENMVFMNTHVVKGRGKAVVVETGMDTEVGDIAGQLDEAEQEETPFQKEVDKMGSRIGLLVIGIIGLVAAIQFALTGADLLTILILGIGLSVAAIPESLPAIVTLTLALGSKKLLNKQALVRRLPVVEALGSVNYIVTDKTGTLTEGVMTVKNVYFDGTEYEVTGTGTTPEGEFRKDSEQVDSEKVRPLLECGFYCNNAEKTPDGYIGDPTETALLVAAKKAGIEQDIERRKTIPFSSDRKRMTVVSEQGTAYMKGAPGVVLDRCTTAIIDGEKVELDDELRQEIIDKNTEYATDALRVLGFARKPVSEESDKDDIESEMTFLGLQGMIDPARDEVNDAIQDCRTAGIGVVMATGDNIETAKAIGKELGFKAKNALTGPEIEDMSVEKLSDVVKDTEIFARVSPRHKVKVLEALQDQGFNVAMTGDGVNDAPALKDSDVGVAMGQRGTDVAKKSSDMVLQDDNFATIRDAISEGRGIYDNIRKVTNQLLSTNSGEVMFVFLGTLIGGFFFPSFFSGDAVVLTALMILWVNFASDGPPAIALSEDPNVDGIMERDPREPDEPILDKKILAMTAVTGPLAALTVLPVFFLNIESFQSAQTMLFMGLAFFEMMMFFVIRRDYGLKLADNKYLVAAMALSTIAHLSLLYTPLSDLFRTVPLSLPQWGQVAAFLALFGVCEFGFRRLLSKRLGTRKP